MNDSTGRRVALVTGATGAIGQAIAEGFAREPRYEVVLACRNAEKAGRTRDAIVEATGNEAVRCEQVDVSDHSSVRALSARFRGPLHILVNNAADTPRTRRETKEGLELQLATNVLGYHWMTAELSDVLAESAPSRVVMVASYWAGGLDLSDLQFERRPYDNDAAYRQSKQADRMLAVAHAERLAGQGVAVNACHPGDVSSTLSNSLGFGGHESPAEGARTPLWVATSGALEGVSGRYFEHEKERACPFAADGDAVHALLEACQDLTPAR